MFSRLSVRLPPRPFFLLIALHAQVQPLTQLVEEIGAALALAAFDVRIGVIAMAVLYFQPEYLTEKRSQLLDVVLSVVDTADLVERIDDLHQLDETTRPAERRVGISDFCAGSGGVWVWRYRNIRRTNVRALRIGIVWEDSAL